jgi:hypothetical protein
MNLFNQKGNIMDTRQVNYTAEQVTQIVEAYKAGTEVDQIATMVGKTVRSVVAKLSREGVYQPKAKAASSRMTKEDLVARIEAHFEMEAGTLDSFTKASRDQLITLASRF